MEQLDLIKRIIFKVFAELSQLKLGRLSLASHPGKVLFLNLARTITTSSREISLVCLELFIFPYHEIDILTWRRGGEGGKVMSDSVLCEDLLLQDFNIYPSLSSPATGGNTLLY